MLIPDINAIHEIAPPLFIGGVSNRQLPPEEMIYFRVRGISMPDKQELDRQVALLSTTLNPEERLKEKVKLDHGLARKKFVSLHNYRVPTGDGGSREVAEFDEFCTVAPAELVAWFFDVITWGEKLSAAERRNFLAQPASPSIVPPGEAAGSAGDVTISKESGETATT